MKTLILYTSAFFLTGTLSSYGMNHPSQNIIMDDEERGEAIPGADVQLLERKQKMERDQAMERVNAVRNAPDALHHLLHAGNPEENPQFQRNQELRNEFRQRTRGIAENPNDEYAREGTMASLRVDRLRNAPGALDYFPLNIQAHVHVHAHSHGRNPWAHIHAHAHSHYDKEYVAHVRAHSHSHANSHKEALHKELKEFHLQALLSKAHFYWGAFDHDLEREIPGFTKLSLTEQRIARLKKSVDVLKEHVESPDVQATIYELTELFLRGDAMEFTDKTHSTEFTVLNHLKMTPIQTVRELDLLLVSLDSIGRLKEQLKNQIQE